MFKYTIFDVAVTRDIAVQELGWPAPDEASGDRNLGCNRDYLDLRNISWSEARRVLAREKELVAQIENASDADQEYTAIEDELYESDDHLFGLDLGVASTVACLSAAGCVPFTSCNAGTFGGQHHEDYPLVAFFARKPMIHLLLAAAQSAGIGLEHGEWGCLLAFAKDIRKLQTFAESLIDKQSAFNGLGTTNLTPGAR